MAIEICAGSGILSRALFDCGFEVVGIDKHLDVVAPPHIALSLLDLTSPSGQRIFWGLVDERPPDFLHLGLPCGTCSRARERPVSSAQLAQGAPNPKPLRSEEYLMGLPTLPAGSLNLLRVQSANALFLFAVHVLHFAFLRNIIISIENPWRSYLWAILAFLIQEHYPQDVAFFDWFQSLAPIRFHSCMHGGTRRKDTCWLSSPSVFSELASLCTNQHPHEDFALKFTDGHWLFDTAKEAAYPRLLARRAADCLHRFFSQPKFVFLQPPVRVLALASSGTQSKKQLPLIGEYLRIVDHPLHLPIPPNGVLLPPIPAGGDVLSEERGEMRFQKLGILRTPLEFVREAFSVKHPFDSCGLEKHITDAIDWMAFNSRELIEIELKKNLLKLHLWAKQLEHEEVILHQKLEQDLEIVVKDKKLLLWKKLLELTNYDDPTVFKQMTEGVHLVGTCEKPDCFKSKIIVARLEESDLRSSSIWRRKAIMSKVFEAEQVEQRACLEKTAEEEVSNNFIMGPYFSEGEVSSVLGHSQWSIVRRFVIAQEGGRKLRPIDNCLESQLNEAYTSTIKLELQDVDYVAATATEIAKVLTGRSERCNKKPRNSDWVGKCYDLTKAYKQMAIWPGHRDLAVIYFKDCSGRDRFYVPRSLLFGSTAAVYSFNRVSRSLAYLINTFLKVPTCVYFDDFPVFVPENVQTLVDKSLCEFFRLLGWKISEGEEKAKCFSPSFDVLGISIDIKSLKDGMVLLSNKKGRIEKIESKIEPALRGEELSKQTRQEVHGLLNFSSGFFAGKSLRQANAMIFEIKVDHRNPFLNGAFWAKNLLSLLKSLGPRKIDLTAPKEPILVFTDGSWENGTGGMGAVVIDTVTGSTRVFEGKLPRPILEHWLKVVGQQIICQIELLVVVLIRRLCREEFLGRRLIFFIDNEAARFGLIRGRSGSSTMNALINIFLKTETLYPAFSWIERVASSSNPADMPSRFQGERCAFEFRGTLEPLLVDEAIIQMLTKDVNELYWSLLGESSSKAQ